MSTVTIVLLVIALILLAAVVVLYFLGKRAQKKQEEQQAQIEASKQTVSMLVIDKKRMPLNEAERCRAAGCCISTDAKADAWFQSSDRQSQSRS